MSDANGVKHSGAPGFAVRERLWPPFDWIGVDRIFEPLAPTPWVVPGLQLGPGRPTLLVGYGSSGKTIAAQSLALSVAANRLTWGEFHAKGPMKVRHVDHEQGSWATKKRYQRLALGLGIVPDELANRLQLCAFPPVHLNDPQAEKAYASAAEGFDLVVIDALRAATPGVDENDSKIRACIDLLTRVSEKTGAAFLVIHHAAKPRETHNDGRTILRGSSAIFDAAGSTFVMQASDRDPRRLVRQAKMSASAEGGPIPPFYLAIEDVPSDALGPTAGLRVCYQPAQEIEPRGAGADRKHAIEQKVLQMIATKPGMTVRELREAAGWRGDDVSTAIKRLLQRAALEEQREGNRRRLYPMTPTDVPPL